MTTIPIAPKKPVNFFKRLFIETMSSINEKLPGSAHRLLEYISACCTFPDEIVIMPNAKDLSQQLNMGLSTFYRNLTKVKRACPFLQIETNSSCIMAYRTDPNNPKKFFDFQNRESFPFQENKFLKYIKECQKLESQQLEALAQGDSFSPQTLQTFQTPQTGGENDLKFNKESNQAGNEINSDSRREAGRVPRPAEKSVVSLFIPEQKKLDKELKVKENVPANVASQNSAIPQDLLEKLQELEIEPTEQVINAIKKHHISQAYGAAAHIESTWVTIRNPRKVFLHQLPKQPIEEMGMRYGAEAVDRAKREHSAIELERQTPEYQAGWQEAKAKINRILGR